MTKLKAKIPPNPHARKGKVVFRVNNAEMQDLLTKSSVYADMSEYIRFKLFGKPKKDVK